MRRMRLVSRAAPGTPVSYLVQRAEETAARVAAALPETKPHKRCLNKVAALHQQVEALCPCLVGAGGTLQQLLYLTRALPLLRRFHDRLRAEGALDDEGQPPSSEPADGGGEGQCGEDGAASSSLFCGGPLWTRLTAEVCQPRCRPQRLVGLLSALPRRLLQAADQGQPETDLDKELQEHLGLRPRPRGAKRRAQEAPARNTLIGMVEGEDDLQPIKIPQLDPSLFKPLPD